MLALMGKRGRVRHQAMPHLRAWRDSLGLSRQVVVDRMSEIDPDAGPVDQATLAKWEAGETAVRVEDLELLARIYGVTADRLFFAPGDKETPGRIRKAFDIITTADPDLLADWLRTGEGLRKRG